MDWEVVEEGIATVEVMASTDVEVSEDGVPAPAIDVAEETDKYDCATVGEADEKDEMEDTVEEVGAAEEVGVL